MCDLSPRTPWQPTAKFMIQVAMDDLFIEVQKRDKQKLSDVDCTPLHRRGSSPVVGLKQRFAGITLEQHCPTATAAFYLLSSGSVPLGHKTNVDCPYGASTNVSPQSLLDQSSLSSGSKRTIHPKDMKKIPTDPRLLSKHKAPSSNTQWYVTNEYLGLPPAGNALHHAMTSDTPLPSLDFDNTVSEVSDGSVVTLPFLNAPSPAEWTVGSGAEPAGDAQLDEVDANNGQAAVDPLKTREAIEHYRKKIERIVKAIKAEQAMKQENVNEYLLLSNSADKMQLARIKTVFEKKNQKSTNLITQLQRKLEICQKRLKEIEMFGVCSSKQGMGVLKDVGHGIKTMVSKPKEFAHLLRNKFGSADNISVMESLDDSQHSEQNLPVNTRRGSITLPSHFKFHSTDNMITLDSQASDLLYHSDIPNHQVVPIPHRPQNEEFLLAVKELEESRSVQYLLEKCIDDLKVQIEENQVWFKHALDEEKVRREHLEEQLNDLMELHQNEVANLKQELSSIEEKMEYQLEERTRDMQDLLESCQTKITKMDLQQQQQQQLISMESFDNSTVRTVITKLINVVLALLAVVLVLINTTTNLLEPFVNTRFRFMATIVGAVAALIMWQNSDLILGTSHAIINWYRSPMNH